MESEPKCECCNKEIKIKYVKCVYTDAQKKAIYKYREKHPDVNRNNAKSYYDKMKDDPEWKAKFNERSRLNAQRYRDKKKLNLLKN
jgi:hypothetical protein